MKDELQKYLNRYEELQLELQVVNSKIDDIKNSQLTVNRIFDKLHISNDEVFNQLFGYIDGTLSDQLMSMLAYRIVAYYLNEDLINWQPDWQNLSEDDDQLPVCIELSLDSNIYVLQYGRRFVSSQPYFKTPELARECIEIAEASEDELGFNFLDVIYKY